MLLIIYLLIKLLINYLLTYKIAYNYRRRPQFKTFSPICSFSLWLEIQAGTQLEVLT